MSSIFFYLYASWALLVLRLAMGAIFIVHGWPKIKNLKQTAMNFDGMGFKPGSFWGTVAAFLEFFGGIGVVLGLFTMFFGGLFLGEFFVILLWQLKKHAKFVDGWELDLIIFAGAAMLLAVGAGPYSLDRLFAIWL